MRQKVAAKRALAAQIQTAVGALTPPLASEHVITTAEDRLAHPEIVLVSIAPGTVEATTTDGKGPQLTRSDFVLDVVVAVAVAGMTGTEAEDRCALLADTIRRSLRDPQTFRDALRPLTPVGEVWTVVAVQIQADDGPTVLKFADQGQACTAGYEVSVSMHLGRT